VRVYLPATIAVLQTWLAAGEAPVGGDAGSDAFAVTPALREWYREADLDELEHAAQADAARASLQLLAADRRTRRCRVVLAADVDETQVTPDPALGRAAVRLSRAVPVRAWSSALVDDDEAATAVRQAVDALGPAAAGDDDAQFVVDETEAYELGWYAVQELPALLS
jgi:hypothetical protein